MTCGSCGSENGAGARFCGQCGNALARVCHACRAESPPGSSYCVQCGTALAASVPQPEDRDPRDYTPRHLAERILSDKAALEGERKHVTVVFMDVVGFTSLSEPTDPEDVHTIINRCVEIILGRVHAYEGTVTQFTGDGVLALFGAPVALEDAPRRAIAAALDVQEALEPLRREVRTRLGTDFRMRVGIHSGLVVVGTIGNDLRMDYTAVGDTTNLASRLESLASPGSVLISEATARQVPGFFDLNDLGAIHVKGRQQPVRAYEVVGKRNVRGRLEASIDAGLTDFIGRERELEALQSAFRSASEGRGQIVFMVGDAGIGKSRLLYELRQQLKANGDEFFWSEGRCTSNGRTTAFAPFADSVRRAYGIDDRDDDETAVAKMDRAEERWGEDLRWTLPYLRSLLSLPVGDDAAKRAFERLDAGTRRSEMQRAIESRLLRLTTVRPLVLVIEDLHWIDTASEEILSALSDSVATARALLILTHRPGYRHPLGDRSYHARVALQPLSDSETASVAKAVVGDVELPATLGALVAEKAEGNPFFAEEVMRSLLEDDQIRVENGCIELSGEISSLSIPDRIQDVLSARIDRLEQAPKRTIQVASVIGREFAMRLLDRISEAGEQIAGIVEELRTLELIYQKSSHPELAFMFKHALIHDVAYESVLLERRKTIHRVVGESIEALYPDRLTEHYEALAHHFSLAEAWEEALRYHDRAAHKAAEAYANHSAAEHLRAALDIAERLGDGFPRSRRASLSARLGYACLLVSDFRGARDGYALAAELSDDAGDRATHQTWAAYWAFWAHDYEDSARLLNAARESARESGDPIHETRVDLIQSYRDLLIDGPRALDESRKNRIITESAGDDLLCSMAQSLLGEHNEWTGDYPNTIIYQERALALARKARSPVIIMQSHWFLAKAVCCLGDYGRALKDLREAVDLSVRIGDLAWKTRLLNTLGWALSESGRDDEASHPNEQSTLLAEEMVKLGLVPGAPELYGNAATNLACNRIATGDFERARDGLASVQAELDRSDDPWMRWRFPMHLWDALGRLELATGNPDRTLEWTKRELDAARAHDARKLEARALELRARALVVMDDREQARVALAEATRIASAIGYPPVLWRADSLAGELAKRDGTRDLAERYFASAEQRVRALVHSDLDLTPRRGLEGLAERLRSDPLRAYR